MSENINNQYDFFKLVNLDADGNIGVTIVGGNESAQPFEFTADNYTGLLEINGMSEGDLAYIINSQGTQWLPGTIGGSYYPSGIYVYISNDWVSDSNAISYQLYTTDERLSFSPEILADFYQEFIYVNGDLTKIIYWDSVNKMTKRFTKDLTYTLGSLTQIVITENENNTTQTKTLIYDLTGNLINIIKT